MQAATTVTVGSSSVFPSTAEVIAAKPSDPGLFGETASTSIAQTVQSPGFDLKTIYIRYNTSTAVTAPTLNLNIFTVADIGAATLAVPPSGPGLLLTESITFPLTSSSSIAAIELDVPLTLAASAGTGGYAIHLATSGITTFQWSRTGTTAGSVYAGGFAYDEGAIKTPNPPGRDMVLALSSLPVPEPTTAALLGLGLLSLLGRLASRRAC